MRPALGRQLRRYPQTFAAALAHPARLQGPDARARQCGPVPFVLLSTAIGYVLCALLADDNVFRFYEWRPVLAPVLAPLTHIPGFVFLFTVALMGASLLGAAILAYVVLWVSRAKVPLGLLAETFAYFAGGPMMVLAVLVQSIGLPFVLGAVVDLPDWLKVILPLAAGLYLVLWLARQIGALHGVGWWRGLAAAAVAAVAYILVGLDPVAATRLEAYAMTVNSMAPQINAGSVSLANGTVYRWRQPDRGELVVFEKIIAGARRAVLRRVVGLAGDTVELRGGKLLINGAEAGRARLEGTDWAGQTGVPGTVMVETLPEGQSYKVVKLDAGSAGDDTEPVSVPFAHVYVLADNRDVAIDSRQFGPVPVSDLLGAIYYQLTPQRRQLH